MTINDNYDPCCAVSLDLVLKYLIEKSEDLAHRDYLGFPLSFRGFGMIALESFPELQKEFLELVSASESPMDKRASRCRDIFIDALARPQVQNHKDHSKEVGEDAATDRGISLRFACAARHDGRKMLRRHDFQFIQIWECMTWIAFQGDAEKMEIFQEVCLRYPDPKERIERLTPILWEVVRSKIKKRDHGYSEQASDKTGLAQDLSDTN